jgi:hypothetical protein
MLLDGPDGLTIEQQIEIADSIKAQVEAVEALAEELTGADNIIAIMKARSALMERLVPLEEELKKVEGLKLGYKPAEIRIVQYRDSVTRIRAGLDAGGEGPVTLEELVQAKQSILRSLERGDYEGALSQFQSIELSLISAASVPKGAEVAEEIRLLAINAQTVLDFEKIEMSVGGVAIMDGARPVALINGDTIAAGEYVDMKGELFVNDVRPHEIEFVYRGVTLVRPLDERTPTPVAKAKSGKSGKKKN